MMRGFKEGFRRILSGVTRMNSTSDRQLRLRGLELKLERQGRDGLDIWTGRMVKMDLPGRRKTSEMICGCNEGGLAQGWCDRGGGRARWR